MLLVDLNSDLHEKLKIYAVTNKITIKKLMNVIVKNFIEEQEKKKLEIQF